LAAGQRAEGEGRRAKGGGRRAEGGVQSIKALVTGH